MGNIVVLTKMNVSWTHNRADILHLKTSNFINLNPKIRLSILHSIILGIGILKPVWWIMHEYHGEKLHVSHFWELNS